MPLLSPDQFAGPQTAPTPSGSGDLSPEVFSAKPPPLPKRMEGKISPYITAASHYLKSTVNSPTFKAVTAGAAHNTWQMASELASLADMTWGAGVAMGPAAARGWFEVFARLLRGDKPTEAYGAGVDAASYVLDKVGSPFTDLLHYLYAKAPEAQSQKATDAMMSEINKVAAHIQKATHGVIPAGAVVLGANTFMAAAGMTGVHESIAKLAERKLEPLKELVVKAPKEPPPEAPLAPKPRIKLRLTEAEAGGPKQMADQLHAEADQAAAKPKPKVKPKLGPLKEGELAVAGLATGAATAYALDPSFRKRVQEHLPGELISLGWTHGKAELGRMELEHAAASQLTAEDHKARNRALEFGLGAAALAGAVKLKGGMWKSDIKVPEHLPVETAWSMKDIDRTIHPGSTDLKELTNRIKQAGSVKKPITVTVSLKDGAAYVTDGNNRLAAARILGLKKVPVKWETTDVPFTKDQAAKAVPLTKLGLTGADFPKRVLTPEEKAAHDDISRLLGGYTGSLASKEAGRVDPKLLIKLSALGLGAAAGAYLDPNDKYTAALLGALGAGVATAVSPRAVLSKFRELAAKDTRVRIDHLADANDHTIKAAARSVWQLQNRILDLVPSEARRAQISHYLEGDKTIKLTPKELEAAKMAREYFEGMKKQGLESGVLKGAIQNYLTHLWGETPTKGQLPTPDGGGAPRVSPFTPFAKERIFKGTLAEGKARGMVPRTEDVAQIIGIYGNSVARAIANKRMIDSIKAAHAPDGTPLVMNAANSPIGYVAINHPQFSGLRVHPDIAPSLRFTFEAQTPGNMMRGLEALNIATKRMVVSFSLFHAKALLDAAIGGFSSPVKALKVAALSAAGKDSLLRQLREGGMGDQVDKALKGGLMLSLERATPAVEDVGGPFYQGMGQLQQFLDRAVPFGGLPVKAATALNHAVDTFMWARLHAGMKLELASEKAEQLLRNNPNLSEDQAWEIASSFANNVFGGLNWRRIAEETTTRWGRDLALSTFSPFGRRVMQLIMFAPDWTISTVRSFAKAFGPGSGLKGLLKPQTLADLHRQYILRSAIYYLAVGDGINYAMTGHHIWQNQDPTTIDMGDGRKMQWSKHTMEPIHWFTKPGQQALNKLGVLPSEALEQSLGVQYLTSSGHAPRMTGTKQHLEHLAKRFMPITGESFESGGVGAGIASFLGVPIYGKSRAAAQRERERKRLKREGKVRKLK